MLENIVVEDCTPKQDPLVTTGTGNAASERGCGLKGGELRVDELLHVAPAVTRPENIGSIHQHVVRKHIEGLAKGIHLPIRRTAERQVQLELPGVFALSLRVEGFHRECGYAFVHPWPAKMCQVAVEVRDQVHTFV